jgi:L-ascorbate metabolism protein UlaG (beta-lactamase superfamily)
MKMLFGLLIVMLPALAAAQTTVPATGGNITITPIMHAAVQLEHGGRVIQVDPWSKADLSKAKPADLVLVTDIHGDHMDPAAIAKVRKAGAPVVMPAAVQAEAAGKIPAPVEVFANGQTRTVAGVPIEAIAAYNLQRGPKPGEFFHTKGRANAYVITLGGQRVFLAGDTECVPEIKALKNIDIAFLPMNLPYTMPPAEAAECVKAFQPRIAIPYHYQGQKVEEFEAALKGSKIEVRRLNFYPGAPAGN